MDKLKGETHQNSTKNNYYNVWKNFNKFIIRLDRIPTSWEKRTCLYCTYLICHKKLKSSTIKSYVSGAGSLAQW